MRLAVLMIGDQDNTFAHTATGQEIPGVVRFGVFGAGAFRPLPYPPLLGELSLPERIAW